MSETTDRSRSTLDEASRWFTDLKRPTITAQALHDFREWRRDAANAAAFAEVERMWSTAAALADDPEIAAATQAALAAHPPRPARTQHAPLPRGLLPLAIGLASLALAGGGVTVFNKLHPTYSTGVGGQRLEVLSDGSRVRLNTDTRLQVWFSRGQRRVTLARGEAFFDVAHDASRPFIVDAHGTQVRALGTRFNVRRDADRVRVTLAEGRVQVRQDGQPETAVLTPNQALTVTAAGLSAPQPENAADAASWTTGRLTFRGAPLSAAIAEVNRYSQQKVVLAAPPAVAAEPVSGVFDPGDTQTFVAALQAVFKLKVTAQSEREIRLGPQQAPRG